MPPRLAILRVAISNLFLFREEDYKKKIIIFLLHPPYENFASPSNFMLGVIFRFRISSRLIWRKYNIIMEYSIILTNCYISIPRLLFHSCWCKVQRGKFSLAHIHVFLTVVRVLCERTQGRLLECDDRWWGERRASSL